MGRVLMPGFPPPQAPGGHPPPQKRGRRKKPPIPEPPFIVFSPPRPGGGGPPPGGPAQRGKGPPEVPGGEKNPFLGGDPGRVFKARGFKVPHHPKKMMDKPPKFFPQRPGLGAPGGTGGPFFFPWPQGEGVRTSPPGAPSRIGFGPPKNFPPAGFGPQEGQSQGKRGGSRLSNSLTKPGENHTPQPVTTLLGVRQTRC